MPEVTVLGDELRRCVTVQVEGERSLPDLLARIRELQLRGLEQEAAYRVLEEARQSYGEREEIDDFLLEVLDFVSGWCSPDSWIWPTAMKPR